MLILFSNLMPELVYVPGGDLDRSREAKHQYGDDFTCSICFEEFDA